jgi:hypothetical protein
MEVGGQLHDPAILPRTEWAGSHEPEYRNIKSSAVKTQLYVMLALSLGVKMPGREADQSPPSSAEVKE